MGDKFAKCKNRPGIDKILTWSKIIVFSLKPDASATLRKKMSLSVEYILQRRMFYSTYYDSSSL